MRSANREVPAAVAEAHSGVAAVPIGILQEQKQLREAVAVAQAGVVAQLPASSLD